MEPTKEPIKGHRKKAPESSVNIFTDCTESGEILSILRGLGRLPICFNDSCIIPLVADPNQKIRFWSVKTLGKTKRIKNLNILEKVAKEDESTEVRREAISSIGRIRDKRILPILIQFLGDADPKVVLQAIRGLLVFKADPQVADELKKCAKHPNEMVQKIIEKEYFSKNSGKRTQQAHPESYAFLKNVIVSGDVREILQLVPDESFHLTFTSPPYYNARDYSIYKSYQEYLNFLEQVFSKTYDKTKEGRFLIVNTSPIIIPRVSRQHSSTRYPIPFDIHNFLVPIGWEFIDDIVWEKPESSVKNRNAGFLQHRKPLAYKPNAVTEYLMVYRKKTDKLIDWNIRQYDSDTVNKSKVKDGYETSNVWKIDPVYNKVHSAVFPTALCKRVIEYYSYQGDLIFDPFAGSGTLGRVAKSLGRFFFLTEKEPKYFHYMKSLYSKEGGLLEKEESRSTFLTLKEYKNTIKI
ncbi:MAG: HEAT repeat domain-containing protein [Chromatiales bacterium]|nr:HEAT repeat domain-containing protein [Chromatiales bacterium]